MSLVTAVNPELELAFDDIKRRRPLPLAVLEALDGKHMLEQRARAAGIHRETLTTQVKEPFYQRALDLYERVVETEKERIERHARVREALAAKLSGEVANYARVDRGVQAWAEYQVLAQKLLDARQFGAYGVDRDQVFLGDDDAPFEPVYWYANRAGLVKLCPSDARWEGRRLGGVYADRLDALDKLGYVLRYAVFTLPNFPQWHLRSGLEAFKYLWYKRIFYAKRDGTHAKSWRDPGRLFPNLVGAVCTLEAPLSARYEVDPSNAWHVHLNVVMVFKPDAEHEKGWPDYGALREAWGAHVNFQTIPQGDRNATQAALKELLKYPVRAVSEKSAEDRKPMRDHEGNELPPAPPMIEWPACYVDEWWRAHKRFRRTWSCGQLYNDKVRALDGEILNVPRSPRRNPDSFEALGPIWVEPACVTILPPMRDSRERDAEQRRRKAEHHARLTTDPEYAAQVRARELHALEAAKHRRRRLAAQSRWLTFIQGNNSARRGSTRVVELPRVATGPPEECV